MTKWNMNGHISINILKSVAEILYLICKSLTAEGPLFGTAFFFQKAFKSPLLFDCNNQIKTGNSHFKAKQWHSLRMAPP